MTETVKTLIYAGVAILLMLGAVWASLPPEGPTELENGALYPEFTEPKEAVRLEIAKVDEAKGKLDQFVVERSREGAWVIPSNGNYPADATAQMSEAATSLINLDIIATLSDVDGQHELYG